MEQDAHRPEVDDNMMCGYQQDVISRRACKEAHSQQWALFEIEMAMSLFDEMFVEILITPRRHVNSNQRDLQPVVDTLERFPFAR
jgi:hypothetical protein